MQHAVVVGKLERVAHALHHGGRLVGGEQAVFGGVEQLGEACALDIFHDDVGVLVVVVELDHLDDVGVGQHAGGARLVKRRPQQGAAPRVAEIVRHAFDEGALRRLGLEADRLDGHAAHEAGVPTYIDGAEAALATRFEHAVAAQQELLGQGLCIGGGQGHPPWVV